MRNLLRLAAATVTMALGIGAATAIFSLIRPTLLHPFTFPHASELVLIDQRSPTATAPASLPDFRDWSTQRTVFADMAAFDIGFFQLTGIDAPEEIPGALVTTNLFTMLGVSPALGRTFQHHEERVVILSDAAWHKRFAADPNILGRTIALDFSRTPAIERYTVIGVMPPNFWMYYGNFEVFVPLERALQRDDRNARQLQVIARRAPGVTIEQAQSALAAVSSDPNWTPRVRDWQQSSTQPVRSELLLLAAAAALVLSIASTNVAGLLLVRAHARRREIAIRSALGASPWRLTRFLLGDSRRVAIASAILGALLAWWGVHVITAVLPADIEQTRLLPGLDRVSIDPWALAFAAAAALIACTLAGLVPSISAARIQTAPASQRSRKVLVAIEVALSVVLLAGAGLLLRSLDRIRAIDLGFRPERLLILRVPPPRGNSSPAYFSELTTRVAALPGVRSASLFSSLEGRPRPGEADLMIVQPGYFETFGIPLRRGRAFDDHDQHRVIVNESAARHYWPNSDPVGQLLPFAGEALEVIGVAADTRPAVFRDAPPLVYRPLRDGRAGQLAVRTAGDPLALARAVTGVVRDLGGVVAEVGTMQHFVENSTWQHEQAAGLLGAFAAIALILSTTGLYGVLSFAVARRTREIGIRIAVGATRAGVARLVLIEMSQPVFAGLAAGIVVALAAGRLLTTFLYQVAPSDPAVLAVVAIASACAALAACAMPLRRALQVDPLTALRSD